MSPASLRKMLCGPTRYSASAWSGQEASLVRSKIFSLHQALLIGLVLMLVLIMPGCGSAGAGATKASPASSPGSLSASPMSIDFGIVAVGSTKDQPLTLSNQGGATVNVSQVQ